jgi:hypothetical protein
MRFFGMLSNGEVEGLTTTQRNAEGAPAGRAGSHDLTATAEPNQSTPHGPLQRLLAVTTTTSDDAAASRGLKVLRRHPTEEGLISVTVELTFMGLHNESSARNPQIF